MLSLNLFLFKRGHKLSFLNVKHDPEKLWDRAGTELVSGPTILKQCLLISVLFHCYKPQENTLQLNLSLADFLKTNVVCL